MGRYLSVLILSILVIESVYCDDQKSTSHIYTRAKRQNLEGIFSKPKNLISGFFGKASKHVKSWRDIAQKKVKEISLTVPGTKWCGIGYREKNNNTLGALAIDKCCKDHYHCPDTINKGEDKYCLHNEEFKSSSCACDYGFLKCIYTTVSENGILSLFNVQANSGLALIEIYFKLLAPHCIQDMEKPCPKDVVACIAKCNRGLNLNVSNVEFPNNGADKAEYKDENELKGCLKHCLGSEVPRESHTGRELDYSDNHEGEEYEREESENGDNEPEEYEPEEYEPEDYKPDEEYEHVELANGDQERRKRESGEYENSDKKGCKKFCENFKISDITENKEIDKKTMFKYILESNRIEKIL